MEVLKKIYFLVQREMSAKMTLNLTLTWAGLVQLRKFSTKTKMNK